MTTVEGSKRKTLFRLIIAMLGATALALGIFSIGLRLRFIAVTSADFMQDYYAAVGMRAGQSIYASEQYVNNHPPFVAILTLPFTFLTYDVAASIWCDLTLLCLGLIVGLIWRGRVF